MRLGVLGARADRRGLATMTTEFCRHMKPDKVMGVEVPGNRADWSDYDRETLYAVSLRRMTDDVVHTFLAGLDVCYLAETDYDPHRPGRRFITEIAKQARCKLVLHAMPEMCRFATGSRNRNRSEPEPDLIVLPSHWMEDRFPAAVVLPFPVNRTLLPPVRRVQARRFLHVVGRPAMDDRSGADIVSACKPSAEVVIHVAMQRSKAMRGRTYGVVVEDRAAYHDIYAGFDVLLHPRRYGGQSLPLMEAASSAMPVIALDRIPERDWLPPSALLPVTSTRTRTVLGGDIEVADADPVALAAKVDELASRPTLVEELSEASDEMAKNWSWEVLGPKWRDLLESVCAS